MHLLPECINALQYRSFWESTDKPSLNKFLYYRFSAGNLQEEDTEHSRYTAELNVLGKYYGEASEVGQKLPKWKMAFKDAKKSMPIQRFWELQEKRKTALTKTKLREEHFERRVKITETKAIAKIRKLRAVQDITIAKVATEALSTTGSNSKRFLEHELQIGPVKHFRTREPDREVNSDGSFEDDEEVEILIEDSDNSSLANHAQSSNRDGVQTAKLSLNEKLVKVGHGIAHYKIIFLQERGLYDEIKEQFSDQEWQALESSWSEVEEKITQQLSSIVNDNIESLLEEYARVTANATTGFQVELGSVVSTVRKSYAMTFPYLFAREWPVQWTQQIYTSFLICYQTPINVLHDSSASEYEYRDLVINPLWRDVFFDVNHIIRMRTGEVENLDRKLQKNLSKFPNERRAIGWLHDAILVMKVASVDVQVGFGEVVGNACEQNDGKMCEDRTKILKAMQLALVQLRRLLLEKGVDKSLLWNLETFGILVYRKDFYFYSIHQVDGQFLVDQIDGFVLPDSCRHLKELPDVIRAILLFKGRVLHLHQRIESLLEQSRSQSAQYMRRIHRVVEVLPEPSPRKPGKHH